MALRSDGERWAPDRSGPRVRATLPRRRCFEALARPQDALASESASDPGTTPCVPWARLRDRSARARARPTPSPARCPRLRSARVEPRTDGTARARVRCIRPSPTASAAQVVGSAMRGVALARLRSPWDRPCRTFATPRPSCVAACERSIADRSSLGRCRWGSGTSSWLRPMLVGWPESILA